MPLPARIPSTMPAAIVADVMTRDVVAVAPDTSLDTVARTLARNRISGVPVVDATGRAIGIVSAADIVNPERTATEENGFPVVYHIEDGWAAPSIEGVELRPGRARDVMTPLAFTVELDTLVVDAAATMLEQRIHRLLVVNNGMLCGIVSTLDLLRAFVDDARGGAS
jgi:CBS domain-containing protein